jgi:hypothetical protein
VRVKVTITTYTAASKMKPANIVPTIFKITGARGGRSACAFATYNVCAIVTARCNPRSARASLGSASFFRRYFAAATSSPSTVAASSKNALCAASSDHVSCSFSHGCSSAG